MKLMARLRGDPRPKRLIPEEPDFFVQRDRSRSLCVDRLSTVMRPGYDPTVIVARDLNLSNLQRRRASSSVASGNDLISRRSVFSRRHYGSVELLPQVDADGQEGNGRRFRVESGDNMSDKEEVGLFGSPSTPVLENPEFQTRWYFKYFLGKFHLNYVGMDDQKVPFFLSVALPDGGSQCSPLYRAILWRKTGAQKISISSNANKPFTVKQILSNFPNMDKLEKGPKEMLSPDLQKDLLLLEEQEGSVNFKFGVLYARAGQAIDDEMFSNEIGSSEFDKFVSLLGDKIRLKGWDRYRGGLDVKGDMTGKFSIYTIYEGHEIMFHVSTLLPHSKDNRQQVERKRHIGNDIVNIVFLDGDPGQVHHFNPAAIKSQFTHIFAVVSYVAEDNAYRLSVFSEESVPLFGPLLPTPPVFNDSQEFRDFLLVKLINGEKAAFNTPTFAQKRERTLDVLIKDLYSEHVNEGKESMLNRIALSDVIAEPNKTNRRKEEARQVEFVRIGQALKLDTIVKGDAPTSLATTGLYKRTPWEPRCFYPDLNLEIICGDSWGLSKLVIATEGGVFVLEDGVSQRPIFDKTVLVKQLSVVEAHGILLIRVDKGRDNKICVFRLSDFENDLLPEVIKTRQDLKEHRLEKTKGCHLYAVSRPGGSHLRMVVAIGRKLLVMQWRHSAAWTAWCPASDTDTVDGFQYMRELTVAESPTLMTLVDSCLTSSAGGSADNYICVGYRHQFDIVSEKSGELKATHVVDAHRVTLVTAVDLFEDEEPELLLCYNNTCHFQKLSPDSPVVVENDFHWNAVPTDVVCAFPYVLAFSRDILEIRLIINGNLVQTMPMPKLALISSKADIFFATTAPEFFPTRAERLALDCTRERDATASPPLSPHGGGSPEAKPFRLYRIPLQSLSGMITNSERRCPTPSPDFAQENCTTVKSELLVQQDSSGNLLPPDVHRGLSRSCSSSPTPHQPPGSTFLQSK